MYYDHCPALLISVRVYCRLLYLKFNITALLGLKKVSQYYPPVNIAVNIWWRHGVEVNFSNCDEEPGTTIKNLTFIGFGALHDAQENKGTWPLTFWEHGNKSIF